MRIVYSNKLIEGLEGLYKNPQFFEKPETGATEVYTDDPAIAEVYAKLKGVKIFKLNGKPFTFKKSAKVKNSEKGAENGIAK